MVDCIKVENCSDTERREALNIINDPNFDVGKNIFIKSLDELRIGLNLYFEDDSYEHLCEVGQILFAVNLCPAKMGGWMSSDSTLIDSWSVDKISLPRALKKVQPSSDLKIGIIDTGIQLNTSINGVQVFNGKVDTVLSRDFTGLGNPFVDTGEAGGHGTMVASTALNMLGTNLGSSSPLVSLKVSEN